MCTASHIDRNREQRLQASGVIVPEASGSRRRDPSALRPERLRWPEVTGITPTFKSLPPSQTAAPLRREKCVTALSPSPQRKLGPRFAHPERDASLRWQDGMEAHGARTYRCRASSPTPTFLFTRPQGLEAVAGASPPPVSPAHARAPPRGRSRITTSSPS